MRLLYDEKSVSVFTKSVSALLKSVSARFGKS